MRDTHDGYIIGRSPLRLLTTLGPGVVLIALLIGLLLGFAPVKRTALFDVGVGLAIVFFAVGEGLIVRGFIERPTLLSTSASGLRYFPVRAEPFDIPWSQVATLGVHERLVGGQVMRSLVLTLRPQQAGDPGAPDRISIPAHELSTSAARCLKLLAERHREQIALNTILVFSEPQVTLAGF